MVNIALVLAQSDPGIANALTPVYYGIGILALIVAGLWALKKYGDKQRQTLIQQGVREQSLSDRLEANTKAADKNTASIEKMSEKFDAFSAGIDKRMTLADYRIERLEENVNGNKTHDRT